MSKLQQNAPHADITYRIIGAAMAVHNEIGPGHRKEVYQRALTAKMPQAPFDLTFVDEPPCPVYNEQGSLIFTYRPDFIVEQVVIVEIKALAHLLTSDELAQVIDYFAATTCTLALLINFGRQRLEYRRVFPPKQLQIRRKWSATPK